MKAIGADLGGTWMRAAVVEASGLCTGLLRRETRADRAAEEIVADLLKLVEATRADSSGPVAAVGVAVPTTLDRHGALDFCPNLPTMSGFPLVDALSRTLAEPVSVENDARCFALGEWHSGAGRRAGTVIGVTLGTSVGLGVVLDGHLLRGAHGQAGEIWRLPLCIEPGEPQEGVHSALRGQAIEQIYAARSGHHLSASEIGAAARAKDEIALKAFRRYGGLLGGTLAWVCNIVDPDVIVVGGSVAKDFQFFGPSAIEALNRPDVSIVLGALGDNAGVLGAALGAFRARELG